MDLGNHRILPAHRIPDRGHDFKNDPGPVFNGSPVFICSLVEMGNQELVEHEVVNKVEFHRIKPGLFCPDSRISHLFYRLADILFCHGFGRHLGKGMGHGRRSPDLPFSDLITGHGTGIADLEAGPGPVFLHALGKGLECGDLIVIVESKGRMERLILFIDVGETGNDQGGASRCHLFIDLEQFWCGHPVLICHFHGGGTANDPVLQFQCADLNRIEQISSGQCIHRSRNGPQPCCHSTCPDHLQGISSRNLHFNSPICVR